MQVILRTNFETLGRIGEVVTVKPGYARNYLIPRGIAYAATKPNLARLESERKVLMQRDLKERRAAGDMFAKLDGLRIQALVQTGEEDRMFGSVTSSDIADLLQKKGVEVDRRKIQLEEPIKHLGEFDIPIRLHADVTATVKLDVAKQD